MARGIAAEVSGTTIWRWLSEDAIRPWRSRSWISQGLNFEAKAGRVLDLYARKWQDKDLGKGLRDPADEKTSIQARVRCHPTLAPAAGRDMRVEHEYDRGGSLAYLAAWDVHRAKVFGRCEATTGIEPFGRLVEQVMAVEPYASARRVFWVVDDGSGHRGHALSIVCANAGPTRSLCSSRSTPPGSTRSRSTSPSSSARSSRQTTSPISPRSSPTGRLRASLRADRHAIRVEVHPQRPHQAPRTTRRQARPQGRRMTANEYVTGIR